MPDTASIDASERLPWLSDPPRAKVEATVRRRPWTLAGAQGLAGWAVAAVLLVAGASYWLGTQTAGAPDRTQIQGPGGTQPEATLTLPEAFATDQPEVPISTAPEVIPAPAPVVKISGSVSRPASRNRRARLAREEPPTANFEETVEAQTEAAAKETKTVKAAPPPVAKPQPPKLWPSRQVKGAAGRLVQIGAFGSRHQAKLGWRTMQRAYPAVGKLPAVVVESRNSRGRKFYRFQIGTTSQAHSEILCQRMERIDFSCAVLGLPWKAKVER